MRGPPFQIAAACRHRLTGLNRVVGGEAQISLKVMLLGRSYEAPAPKFGRGRSPSRRAARERVRASVELCVAPWPGLPASRPCSASRATAAIAAAVARGELAPTEAAEMSGVVTAYVKTIEANEMERRLRALEEGLARNAK